MADHWSYRRLLESRNPRRYNVYVPHVRQLLYQLFDAEQRRRRNSMSYNNNNNPTVLRPHLIPQRRRTVNTPPPMTEGQMVEILSREQIGSSEKEALVRSMAMFLSILAKFSQLSIPSETLLANNESCSVCLSLIDGSTYVRTLLCTHTFHSMCIDKWLQEHLTCPLCRRGILGNTFEIRETEEQEEVAQPILVRPPLQRELERTPSTYESQPIHVRPPLQREIERTPSLYESPPILVRPPLQREIERTPSLYESQPILVRPPLQRELERTPLRYESQPILVRPPLQREIERTSSSYESQPILVRPSLQREIERTPPPPYESQPILVRPPLQQEIERTPPPYESQPILVRPARQQEIERPPPPYESQPILVRPPLQQEIERTPPPYESQPILMRPPLQQKIERAPSPYESQPILGRPPLQREIERTPSSYESQPILVRPPLQREIERTPSCYESQPILVRPSLQEEIEKTPSRYKLQPILLQPPLQRETERTPSPYDSQPDVSHLMRPMLQLVPDSPLSPIESQPDEASWVLEHEHGLHTSSEYDDPEEEEVPAKRPRNSLQLDDSAGPSSSSWYDEQEPPRYSSPIYQPSPEATVHYGDHRIMEPRDVRISQSPDRVIEFPDFSYQEDRDEYRADAVTLQQVYNDDNIRDNGTEPVHFRFLFRGLLMNSTGNYFCNGALYETESGEYGATVNMSDVAQSYQNGVRRPFNNPEDIVVISDDEN